MSCARSWNNSSRCTRFSFSDPAAGSTRACVRDRRTGAALRDARRRAQPCAPQLLDPHLEVDAKLFVDLGPDGFRPAAEVPEPHGCSGTSDALEHGFDGARVAAPVRGVVAQPLAARPASACSSARGGCSRTAATPPRPGPADRGGAAPDTARRLRSPDRRRSAGGRAWRSRSRAWAPETSVRRTSRSSVPCISGKGRGGMSSP